MKNKMFKNKKIQFLIQFLLLINFSIIFFFSIFINNIFASVDKIVFINEPQTIKVGEFSKQYQIQLQDINNLITTSSDTTYFTLPLELGAFYSKTDGEPFTASSSIYIATNSSNKFFYFKSDIAGEYLMKVYARNKNNTKQWETEQIVKIVDEIDSPFDNNSTSTATTTSTSKANIPVKIKIVYISTHSGEENLSNYNEEEFFKISAGRERLIIIDSPIKFDAKYFLLQKNQCTPIFRWSFGDGFESLGKNVEHIYKYPGEYQIVLNGTCGEYKSVSRTIVKVISPNIDLFNLENGDIEILNNSFYEINIGNWKIKNEQKNFIFSQDTIISAGKKIILSKEDMGIASTTNSSTTSTNKISLSNSINREVFFNNIKNEKQQNLFSSQNTNTEILKNNSNILGSTAEKLIKENEEKIVLDKQKINQKQNIKEISLIENIKNLSDEKIIQTASVVNSINSSSTNNFWSKIIDNPIKNVKSFFHRFYNF
ncbi:MAG: PKD domain-containing protein [bacterium]